MKRFWSILLAVGLFLALCACQKPPENEDPKPSDPYKDSELTQQLPANSGKVEGTGLSWEIYSDGTLYLKGEGAFPSFDDATDIPWYPHKEANPDTSLTVKKVIVEKGVTSLPQKAFAYYQDLKEVRLSDTVKEIGEDAFSECRNLETVSGGIGIEIIRENAFYGCRSLRTLSLSEPIKTVEYGAFFGANVDLMIVFTGNEAEWSATGQTLAVDEQNEVFVSAFEQNVRCLPR